MSNLPFEAVHYLVIGHVSKDLTPDGPTLGGTAAYAALTAYALGLRVGVVTSAGPDLDLTPLAKLHVHCLPSDQSTTFENTYAGGNRQQRLLGKASALHPTSIPPAWRSASIVHLAPIAREVPSKMIETFSGALVCLTPQGWMRTWDRRGCVRRGPWENEDQLLPLAGAVVLSSEDVEGDLDAIQSMAQRCRLLAVTEGARGATVYWQGGQRRFQAPEVDEIDPTGSGDIFAAGFFVRLYQTKDPWESARFANALASASVTRRSIASTPSPEEIQSALEQVSS
ncbi:MAG: PfkB family carbohydrate kinase [Anaerolineales bacterium]|jgi:sugar/nucleoside kinase (ribokinase family)